MLKGLLNLGEYAACTGTIPGVGCCLGGSRVEELCEYSVATAHLPDVHVAGDAAIDGSEGKRLWTLDSSAGFLIPTGQQQRSAYTYNQRNS